MNKTPARRPKSRNALQKAVRLIMRLVARWWMLLIWLAVGLLLSHLLSSRIWQASQHPFETAFESVAQLGESASAYASVRSGGQSKFGISQAIYDAWQQEQGQRRRDVTELSKAEARTIYQDYWQQGQCSQYTPPLDTVCLDSMMSFGTEAGSRFFKDLPPDPKQAAIAVTNRRMDYRRRSISQNSSGAYTAKSSNARRGLVRGLRRDRDLLTQVEAHTAPVPADPLSTIKEWVKSRLAPSQSPLSFDEIYARAEPFTVEVWITVEDGTYAPATGVILQENGLVLTNAHVVEGNPTPTVHVRDRQQQERQFAGQVIVSDRSVDLALIQLAGASGLSVAPLADSAQVKVGDTVYALGSPMGLHWKLTQAEVIAVQSQCGVRNLKCIRMPSGFLHPGNSGGPLIDTAGTVIGINRALQEATGEGVSIPIEDVKAFLRRQENLGNLK